MTEAADLDRDGRLDIVTIDERKQAGGVKIYFGRADGTFSNGLRIDDGSASPYAVAVADLNQDGAPDIVVGNIEAPVAIYYNAGTGRKYTTVHAATGRP